MIYREEVIKKLAVRIQSDSEEWNTIELPIEEANDILSLLKEQEPKPVIITKNAYNYPFYHCPNCEREFYDFYKRPVYCEWCGQAVKWE